MKLNSLKYLLLGVIFLLFSTVKASAASPVVFTGLTGNSPIYLTQSATNDVVWGFSVFVPANKTFSPGPVHIRTSNTLNGFVTGNLIQTTAATPSLALSAPQASYGATINTTIDINGFPNLTGGTSGTTYYYYLVLSITVTANPPPANVYFSLPPSSSITQNGFSGGITTNDLATPTTYYFGINPPTSPGGSTCGPGVVSLTASDASPSGGTYSWYAAATGGLPLSTSATYSPTISTTTTYYVSYTFGLNTSTRTAVIATVNPLASATFTSSASIIAGNSPTVTYTGTDPGTSTYAWSFTGATPATGSGQSPAAVTYLTPGTYTISLTVTNSAGCSTTTSNSITVTAAPPTSPGGSSCGPGVATLTASDVTSGGTYSWYTASTGGSAIATGATYSPTISATTTYYVSFTYGGSTSTRTAVTATLSTVPSSSFTITSSVVTGGNAVTNYTGGDPTTSTYTWNFNGGTIVSGSGQGPYTIQWSTAGTKTVTLTVTNSSGCSSTVTSQSVTVQQLVAPTAASFPTCGAGLVVLTPTGGSPSGGTYNWYYASTGGTAFRNSSLSTYTPTLVSTTTYYVSYTAGGVESARSAITATINPIVTAPYSGAYLSYPFNGNTNDVSGDGNTGVNNGATLTTDRYGAANAAYSFNGTSSYMTNSILDNNPTTYTVSIWLNTTTTTGGSIIGLANSSGYDDRVLYMSNSGQIYWGVYPGSVQTINTTASYNDGVWHHVLVTVGTDGSTLYVDGTLQASNSAMTTGNGVVGFWQIGYSLVAGNWNNSPTSNYFAGSLDDIAVYHRELSYSEISTSHNLNQIFVGTASACGSLTFTAPTITGATYTWKDPNNATLTGQTVSFPGAVAGNYTLTVTGGPGGCSSTVTLTPVISAAVTSAFFVPASIPVSTNTAVTLYSAVGGSTYSWNFGSGASPATGTGTGPFTVQWSTTGVKTITLTVTTSGGCVTTTTNTITVTSTAYGNYTYSRTITLNNKAVGMSGNLTNFPVLLSIQSNDLIVSNTCSDKIQNPNGPNYDFAFFDPSAQSELYYQIESYNSTTGTLLVWVRIPTLYAATNNTLAFYYGAKVPSVTHNATFQSLTWNTDYQAVYHFNETAYQTTTADGTSNGRTATLAGFQSTDYVAAGKIGSCYTFGGTSGSPTANDMEAGPSPVSTQYTLSAWINTSNNASDEKILTNQNSSGMASGGYKMGVYYGIPEDEGNNQLNRSSTPNPTTLANGTWYHVVGVYTGSTMSTYVNGVQYKVTSVSGSIPLTNTLFIGIGEGKQYPFSGMIDEPRVSNVAKSGDWIKMEYTNQNNPSAFMTLSTNATTCSTTNGSSIPGEISYTWTGATSTDPSVATNWNNTATATSALPPFDGSESLIIPTGLSKYPALTASISAYGLTIANGAQLNLNGNILSVGCHIYNGSGGQILYGTSSTAGGITFNGSLTTQYYYGTSTGVSNVANLTINNSAGGTVDITGGAFGVNNMLTLTNGNLLIDNAGSGSLTLLSSATNSASVAAIPTGSAITGNVNVQRYLSNGTGTRGYRLLSSPVNVNTSTTGANTNLGLTYLNTNATFNSTTYYGAYTQGPGTGFNLNGSVHPIIYLYDETQATYNGSFTGGKNIGVYSITGSGGSPAYGVITQGATVASSAINLPTATSYLLYFVGSDQSTSVATSRVPDATTLTATGYLNQGTIPFKFWKTGSTSLPFDVTSGTTNYGLFQVGNPYPSTINLATLYTDNYVAGTNAIGSAFYELIPAGNYVTYNASNGAVSDLRASKYIVSGQGFLAQTTAAGQTLTFKEDQKVAYNAAATLLESIRTPTPTMANAHIINSIPAATGKGSADALQVNTNSINAGLHVQLALDSTHYAQTGIYYKNAAADKYVPSEDAVEIDGGTPQVFLSSYSADNVKLSINTVDDYGQGKRVRLYTNANYSGTYTMSLADLNGIDTTNYNVYLIDNKQADSLDLVHAKTYTFALNTGDTTTYGSNRFVLAIEHKAVKTYQLATFTGEKVSTGVQLNWTALNAGNYTGYTLQKLNAAGGYDSLYSVQSDATITGYNFIDTHPIIGNNTYRLAQNGLTGAITYSAAVTIGYNSTTPNGALTVYPNPAQTIINVSIPSSTISSPNYVADIYNAAGQIVNHQSVTSSKWTNDVSSYKLGVYILQVKDTNGNIVGLAKFMKVD